MIRITSTKQAKLRKHLMSVPQQSSKIHKKNFKKKISIFNLNLLEVFPFSGKREPGTKLFENYAT